MKKLFFILLILGIIGCIISLCIFRSSIPAKVEIDKLNTTNLEEIALATEQVINLNSPHTISYAKKILKDKTTNSHFRKNICLLFTNMKDIDSVPILIEVLTMDENEEVRKAAALALGYIGSKKGVAGLIKWLKDKDQGVRVLSIQALDKIGDPQALNALITILSKDNFWKCRASAAKTIGGFKDRNAVVPLQKVLQDENVDVRIFSAIALGRIGDKVAVDSLLEAMKQAQNKEFRVALSGALFMLTSQQEYLDAVIQAVRDENSDMQICAIDILSYIKNYKAGEAIIGALNDKNPKVRSWAAWILGAIGYKKAVPSLLTLLNDNNKDVVESAVEALGKMGDPSVIPQLEELLNNKDKDIRNSVMLAIKNIKK